MSYSIRSLDDLVGPEQVSCQLVLVGRVPFCQFPYGLPAFRPQNNYPVADLPDFHEQAIVRWAVQSLPRLGLRLPWSVFTSRVVAHLHSRVCGHPLSGPASPHEWEPISTQRGVYSSSSSPPKLLSAVSRSFHHHLDRFPATHSPHRKEVGLTD